jgi:MFS family permease
VAWSGFLLFTTQAAVIGFVVLFLHEERGVSAAAAAAVLGVIQVGGAVLRIGSGRSSDRRRRRIEPIRVLAVATAAALFVVALTTHAPLGVTVAALVVAGSVSMSTTGLLFAATAELAGRRRSGAALGLQQTVLGVAATASPIVFAATVMWSSWAIAFAGAAIFPLAAYAVLQGPLRDL